MTEFGYIDYETKYHESHPNADRMGGTCSESHACSVCKLDMKLLLQFTTLDNLFIRLWICHEVKSTSRSLTCVSRVPNLSPATAVSTKTTNLTASKTIIPTPAIRTPTVEPSLFSKVESWGEEEEDESVGVDEDVLVKDVVGLLDRRAIYVNESIYKNSSQEIEAAVNILSLQDKTVQQDGVEIAVNQAISSDKIAVNQAISSDKFGIEKSQEEGTEADEIAAKIATNLNGKLKADIEAFKISSPSFYQPYDLIWYPGVDKPSSTSKSKPNPSRTSEIPIDPTDEQTDEQYEPNPYKTLQTFQKLITTNPTSVLRYASTPVWFSIGQTPTCCGAMRFVGQVLPGVWSLWRMEMEWSCLFLFVCGRCGVTGTVVQGE